MLSNLFEHLPAQLPVELVDVLVQAPAIRIERIVSTGQSSPPGFWYDQAEAEWVVLLSGAARLRVEHQGEEIEFVPGSYLMLPAHCRHRVEWTTPEEPTVWLAIFFESPDRSNGASGEKDPGS